MGCAAAPRRAPAPTRAVRLVRAGPDRGDDTWGKGQVLAYLFACVRFAVCIERCAASYGLIGCLEWWAVFKFLMHDFADC